MQNIQIFLASSIVEFEEERKQIHDFIQETERILREKRDISLKLIKCENMDNNIVPKGKQNEYDKEIKRSDIVIFLFGEKAGDFTIHELEISAEEFADRKSKIVVLCRKDPYKSDDDTLKKLANTLTKHKVRHKIFVSLTDIKVEFLMKLITVL